MAAVSLFWDSNMAALTSCENTLYVFTTKNPLKFCLIVQLIKERSVTPHYHGSKIIFLESDGHFHCRAMKEK